MSDNIKNKSELPKSFIFSSSESSACYLSNSTAVLPMGNSAYWIQSDDIFVPQPDVLTDAQRSAFTRTMQKHKHGFELLAE